MQIYKNYFKVIPPPLSDRSIIATLSDLTLGVLCVLSVFSGVCGHSPHGVHPLCRNHACLSCGVVPVGWGDMIVWRKLVTFHCSIRGSDSSSTSYFLCDLREMISLLWASVFPSVAGESINLCITVLKIKWDRQALAHSESLQVVTLFTLFWPLLFSEQQDCEIAQEIQEKLAIEAERRRIQEKKDEVHLGYCPSTRWRKGCSALEHFLYIPTGSVEGCWLGNGTPLFWVHSPSIALRGPLAVAPRSVACGEILIDDNG